MRLPYTFLTGVKFINESPITFALAGYEGGGLIWCELMEILTKNPLGNPAIPLVAGFTLALPPGYRAY